MRGPSRMNRRQSGEGCRENGGTWQPLPEGRHARPDRGRTAVAAAPIRGNRADRGTLQQFARTTTATDRHQDRAWAPQPQVVVRVVRPCGKLSSRKPAAWRESLRRPDSGEACEVSPQSWPRSGISLCRSSLNRQQYPPYVGYLNARWRQLTAGALPASGAGLALEGGDLRCVIARAVR
jgi:hypothetical protein